MRKIFDDVCYIGADDTKIDLFEALYPVKKGISYNSYVVLDNKIVVFDTVDEHFGEQWADNLRKAIGERKPDYLIVTHMEPDHSANILRFVEEYPEAVVVGNKKTFVMIDGFFGSAVRNRLEVSDGDSLSSGKHTFKFIFAPMVHWPEVMNVYDEFTGALFSADAFGTFDLSDGALGGQWDAEARRYYFGIVGKYGAQVTALLNKLSRYSVNAVCPLHGPVISDDVKRYIDRYSAWAAYKPERDGVMIAYCSVYGHTAHAARLLADKLSERGCKDVLLADLVRSERSENIANAFAYGKLVLAATTYNADVFPPMREFIYCLAERNYCNRTVAFIENGSWMPMAAKAMREGLAKCRNLTFAENNVTIRSALKQENIDGLSALADELVTRR